MDSPTVSSSKSFFFPNSWYAYFLLVLSFVKILFAYSCFIKMYTYWTCVSNEDIRRNLMSLCQFEYPVATEMISSNILLTPSPSKCPFLQCPAWQIIIFVYIDKMPSMGNVFLFIYLLSFRQFLVFDLGCFPYRTIHSSLTLSRENNLWLGATVYLLLPCFSSFLLSEHCRSVVIIMLLAWGKYILREYLCL